VSDNVTTFLIGMAALRSRCGHYIFALWFLLLLLLSFFFPSPNSQLSQIRCIPYLHTSCGLSANLRCRSEMCCRRLAEIQDAKKSPKIRYLGSTVAQLCRAIPSQLRHVSTIGKKLLNSDISPTCLHNMVNFGPLAAEIGSVVWGTPANFNRFRVLAALLQRRRLTEANQTLHDLWPSPGLVHYIFISGLLPVTEFCQVQNSVCVQVLRSPILTALLHGTRVGASAKLCGVEQRTPPIFDRAAITLGIGPHSS